MATMSQPVPCLFGFFLCVFKGRLSAFLRRASERERESAPRARPRLSSSSHLVEVEVVELARALVDARAAVLAVD
jgi:hypothetical protein